MKKFFLVLFILFDLALIAGAAFILTSHLQRKKAAGMFQSSPTPTPIPSGGIASTSTIKGVGQGLITAGAGGAAETSVRKILFTYRNSKARAVSIRADFTGWKAEPMQKAAAGSWTYMAQLTPGEYAYCFTVDDKTFKDPANKRTKVIGRTTVSSILVEALAPKP